VSLAWRLRRAERLQSAVFATVYRENANDVVLWPKHGLPIQPGPGEDEVILGQVVMTDFARAQVLDRLLVYERRIENSLYRTMAQLRRERQARTAAAVPGEASHSEDCSPAGQESIAPAKLASFGADVAEGGASMVTPEEVSRSESSLPAGQESVAPAKLGSFGANLMSDGAGGDEVSSAKITPDGVTTNPPTAGNHGQDARATKTLHFTLHDRSRETNPIPEGRGARAG